MDAATLYANTSIEPRPYQQRIVGKALHLYNERNASSVLVESPTGSGKTIMALLIIRAMQMMTNLTVGWVSMRHHLLKQAATENEQKAVGAKIEFISMFAKKLPAQLDMLVIDEAQHDAAQSMVHIHNQVRAKYILGMTATPYRGDRLKLCFDSIIKDAGIHRLIQEGYLSPYHHYALPSWDPTVVAGFYTQDPERWGKSLMYFHRITQCVEAQQCLHKAGITAEVVSGNTDIDHQLDAFHNGSVKVLINCQKLTEGFDSPDLKTVFCRPSCKGVTTQMCGRVFRRCPEITFKQIVQPAKTRWLFSRTASPQRQFVYDSGRWLSVAISDVADQVYINAITQMGSIKTEMPKLIQKYIDSQSKGGWSPPPKTPTEANPDGDGE